MMIDSPLPPDVARRFEPKVAVGGPDECWEWTAARHVKSRHGRLVVGGRAGKVEYAHRLAWLHWVGPITADRPVIRHTCDNPPCCNPAHLIDGTQADNMRDCVQRRRHGKEKLTPDQVREIRSADGGYGYAKKLALRYGVHPNTITSVRAGRYRSNVN